MKAKCTGILDSMGQASNHPGFSISLLVRRTADHGTAGDMTLIDFPIQISVPQVHAGAFHVTIDPFEVGCLLFDCQKPPGCSSIQLLNIAVLDPDGNIFAVGGSISR
jgi:hypothetical protein